MKKIYTVLMLSAAATLSVAAQSNFSAGAKAIMSSYNSYQENPAQALRLPLGTPFTLEECSRAGARATVFITVAEGYGEADIEARGFDIVLSAADVVVATGSMDDIAALADCDFVKYVEFSSVVEPQMDQARKLSNVDVVQDGTGAGISRAYTGKGVIAAMYDNGFDPNHAVFLDSNKKSRIKTLFYFSGQSGIYSTIAQADMSTFTTDNSDDYHGTHVMGIEAGYFNGKGNGKVAYINSAGRATVGTSYNNPYYGVATEADIVACAGYLTNSNILKGISAVRDYAQSTGQPAVVNLSLGMNSGSHTPYSSFNKVIDEYGKDVIICIAAGNEADEGISIDRTLAAAGDTYQTFVSVSTSASGAIDIWAHDTNDFTVTPFLYQPTSNKVVWEYEFSASSSKNCYIATSNYTSSTYVHDDYFDKAFSSSQVLCYAAREAGSNLYNVRLEVQLTPNSKTNVKGAVYVLGFRVKANKPNQRITSVFQNSYGLKFQSLGRSGYVDGDGEYSINDMAGANNIIVVGAWNSRSVFPVLTTSGTASLMDFASGGDGYKQGQVTAFSSWGTLPDGREMPHVIAPGMAIIAAGSTPFYEKNTSNANSVYMVANQKYNNRQNYWFEAQGTSMACPFASGVVAMMLEAAPGMSVDQARECLTATAITDANTTAAGIQAGAGKVDALAAVKYAISHFASVTDVTVDDNHFIVNPVDENVWDVFVPATQAVNVNVYNIAGQQVATATAIGQEATVDLSALTPGVYVLNINGQYSQRIAVK